MRASTRNGAGRGPPDYPELSDNSAPQEAKPKIFRKRAGGNHFAVDAALAERALGISLDALLALLVLARGTGGDQRTTRWSVNSIEQREILGRPTAKKAIQQLEEHEIIGRLKNGARRIADRTILGQNDSGGVIHALRIWMPNQLVDGAGESLSPLVALRQTRSVDAARLLLRIYEVNDLEQWGGVPPSMLRIRLAMERLGDRGRHVIFGISGSVYHASRAFAEPFMTGELSPSRRKDEPPADIGWARIWTALKVLDDLKLIERAAYVFDGPPDIGEPIAPCGWGREGEVSYNEAMQLGAARMMSRALRGAKIKGDALKGYGWFAAILRHVADPHAFALIRPRLLPDTEPTRRWLAKLERWRERSVTWVSDAGLEAE